MTRIRDHAFYVGLALAIAALVFAGFARTFYLRSVYLERPLHAPRGQRSVEPALKHLVGGVVTTPLKLGQRVELAISTP